MDTRKIFEDLWEKEHGYRPERSGNAYENDDALTAYTWFIMGVIRTYKFIAEGESDEMGNE